MEAQQVDERDSCWEDDAPRFRVYLFERGPGGNYSSTDTWDITDANVLDAIGWAQDQGGDEGLYAVALVREQRPSSTSQTERGLVWLVGMDWFDNVEEDPERQRIKDGMIARRGRAVVLDDGM